MPERWRRLALLSLTGAVLGLQAVAAHADVDGRGVDPLVTGLHQVSALATGGTPASLDLTGAEAQGCSPAPGAVIHGSGRTMTVAIAGWATAIPVSSIPASWWSAPPETAAAWQLYLRGFWWVGPVVDTGDTDALEAVVETMEAFLRDNPDTHDSTNGWDEGSNLRRQQNLNCLWRVTGDSRLIPLVDATAAANMDMDRYYGPPLKPVHNHGVMANLALLDAGRLFGRPTWEDTAVSRLVNDSGRAWTRSGLAYEQSGPYSLFTMSLWDRVARTLTDYPEHAGVVAIIRQHLVRARAAHAYITDPSGDIINYGDGVPAAGISEPQPNLTFYDASAGVATGRWSWTDRNSTFYALRFGGPRRMHGHQDRTSLIWYAQGMRILDDRSYHIQEPWLMWSRSPSAHSVQVSRSPAHTFDVNAPVYVTSMKRSGTYHRYVLNDEQYGAPHTRTWVIDQARLSATVIDTAPYAAQTNLHLAPAWTVASVSPDRRTITLVHTNGRLAQVTGTAPMAVFAGKTSPIAGWYFPAQLSRAPSVQVAMPTTAGTSSMSVRLICSRSVFERATVGSTCR